MTPFLTYWQQNRRLLSVCQGHSRSSKLVPIDTGYVIFYWFSIVTMIISHIVSDIKAKYWSKIAIFAARCYVVMQCLCVCLFVCPSIMFVDSVKTSKRIFNFF